MGSTTHATTHAIRGYNQKILKISTFQLLTWSSSDCTSGEVDAS